MSFKEKLPDIIIVGIMSITGAICVGSAFHEGYKRGNHDGYILGKEMGRIYAEIDAEVADIKAHKDSGKKEEASN